MPLVENLICSMKRINLTKVAILAMDQYGCDQLIEHGFVDSANPNVVCIRYDERMIETMKKLEPDTFKHESKHLDNSMHNASDWATPIHKIMINSKLYAGISSSFPLLPTFKSSVGCNLLRTWLIICIHLLADIALDTLQCNLGVFVTDADIAFIEDPIKSFEKVTREDPRVQMIFQDDTTDQFDYSLNSG